MDVEDVEVVVVGAGLAGLRCAALLTEAGREVRIWEAADEVGGRIRTDVIDGFRCDRGFQVLNPPIPNWSAASTVPGCDCSRSRREWEYAGKGFGSSGPSAAGAHPSARHDRSRVLRPRDLVALARWASPALRPAASNIPRRRGRHSGGSARPVRVSGELRRVIDRFLSGVVLDDTGATSNAFALLLVRMFALGFPGCPPAE